MNYDDETDVRFRAERLMWTSEEFLPLMRQIAKPRTWEELEKLLPPEPWTYAPLEILDGDLIDWGVSIRQCWLTPLGEKVLAYIETHPDCGEAHG